MSSAVLTAAIAGTGVASSVAIAYALSRRDEDVILKLRRELQDARDQGKEISRQANLSIKAVREDIRKSANEHGQIEQNVEKGLRGVRDDAYAAIKSADRALALAQSGSSQREKIASDMAAHSSSIRADLDRMAQEIRLTNISTVPLISGNMARATQAIADMNQTQIVGDLGQSAHPSAPSSAPPPAPVDNSSLATWTLQSSNLKQLQSGSCLDGDGSKLYFGACKPSNTYQQWTTLPASAKEGANLLKHEQSGKCLDGNGKQIYFGTCKADNQYMNWKPIDFPEKNGVKQVGLQHGATGKCLDGNGKTVYFGDCKSSNPYMTWSRSQVDASVPSKQMVTWHTDDKKRGDGVGRGLLQVQKISSGDLHGTCRNYCENHPECGSIAIDAGNRGCWMMKGHVARRNGNKDQKVSLILQRK
jgi:hypothetical protein